MKILAFVTTVLGLFCASTAFAADGAALAGAKDTPATAKATASALDMLPEAVRKMVLKEAGDNKITGIEKTTKDGKTVYEVEWVISGKETEIMVAEDGTLVDKQTREKPSMPGSPTRHVIRDEMKRVCALSDEQAAKMKAIDEAWDKDSAKWQADNAQKVQAAQKALMQAITKQDGAAIFKAYEATNAAQAPYAKLHDKACAEIMAVLKADQKAAWQEHAVLTSINAWFERAKLTDQQQAAVKSGYAEMAKAKGAKCDDIMVALAEKTRDMLTAEQLKGLSPFLLQMEKTIHLGDAPPIAPAPKARTSSVSDGMLTLDANKVLKGAVFVLGGGYGSVMGPSAGGGNTIALPDSAEEGG